MAIVGDKLWLWSHVAGSYNKAGYQLPGLSHMSAAEGARHMGLRNAVMVKFADRPQPPFDGEAASLRSLDRTVWSVVGDSTSSVVNVQTDLDAVMELASRFPNIGAAVMDDFKPERVPLETVRNIRDALHTAPRPLDLWIVVYFHLLNEKYRLFIELCDVVTVWTWQAEWLPDLEKNLQKIEAITNGAKRIMLGCYMYDFGNKRPITQSQMQTQCEQGLMWLRQRRIHGMIFVSSSICDLNLDAVHWTRSWIQRVAPLEIN